MASFYCSLTLSQEKFANKEQFVVIYIKDKKQNNQIDKLYEDAKNNLTTSYKKTMIPTKMHKK